MAMVAMLTKMKNMILVPAAKIAQTSHCTLQTLCDRTDNLCSQCVVGYLCHSNI